MYSIRSKRILGSVDRSSGSSGWLKDLFLSQYDRYDAMVNYEAVIIETNQELERLGREPLYAIYPVDGLSIADSPLGFIDRGEEGKEDTFLALQQYLLSPDVQRQLLDLGRRTATVGVNPTDASRNVFRDAWGIDINRVLQPIRLPNTQVITEALNLYQTAFRRPSCTAYVLDFSGSMGGDGENDLKGAMRTLLDQNIASQYLLQGHPGDVSVIVLFNGEVINSGVIDDWTVTGNNAATLRDLYLQIERQQAAGNTNIFGSTEFAMRQLADARTSACLPAVIVMTDGQDNSSDYSRLQRYIQSTENDVPIFAITFGSADRSQLDPMVDLTSGRVFDGSGSLVEAFRKAKGYN